MENENTAGISELITRFYKCVCRFWYAVAAVAVIGAAVSVFSAFRSYTPMYMSRAVFSVSSGYDHDDIFSSTPYYDNITATQLAEAFPNVLAADMMRDLMEKELGRSYIGASLSASSVADTNMFVMTARSSSAQYAYEALNAAIVCFPKVAVYMVAEPTLVIRESPKLAEEPYNSVSWKRAAVKGGASGIIFGLIVLLLYSFAVKTILTPDELKRIVSIPILASFPNVVRKKRRSRAETMITYEDDKSFSESLRGMFVKFRHRTSKNVRVVSVTSTLASEGKTTIAFNFAKYLASEGKSVVLVDADLRKQDICGFFESEDSFDSGLAKCIFDPGYPVMECVKESGTPGLSYISGKKTLSGMYNLDRKSVRRVFAQLSEQFDYVIVDTPPCGVVSDSGVLCGASDAVIFVVRQDFARTSQIVDAVFGLSERNAPLTGCVLNGSGGSGSRYGYGYGYGYKYGYKYGYGRNYGKSRE